MTGEPNEATPDITAELAKMLETAAPQTADGMGDQTDGGGDDELAQFQARPTDPQDVAERITQMRRTMTKRTTEIAQEKKRLAEKEAAIEQDRRDAEAFRMLKNSADPRKAAEAFLGAGANGGGSDPYAEVLERHKSTFEPKTYEAINELAEAKAAALIKQFEQKLAPYGQFLSKLAQDQGQNEWKSVVSEYGDEAERWKGAAAEIAKQTGLPMKDAILVASQGQIALSKIKAKVMEQRKRESPSSSIPQQAVASTGINLRREERNRKIQEMAAAHGIERFARP